MRLLELEGINFNHGCLQPLILRDLDLKIESGSCHCISGPTGSGKSSLLALLAGLQRRPCEGGIFRRQGLLVGLVMQDPQVQILRQTVGAEVAFALENLGVPSGQMISRVQHALRRVGLFVSLETQVSKLSLGQKYRLMIAAQLVSEPAVLLLDEPWAQLDDAGVDELLAVIRNLLAEGMAVVLVEHNPQAFSSVVEHFWYLDQGRLLPGSYRVESASHLKRLEPDRSRELVSATSFEFRYQGHSPLFVCQQGLSLGAGELVTLVGNNGSGKSSLLKAIAGIQPAVASMPLRVFGRKPKPGAYGPMLGLLMQRPNRQLFEATVIEEMQFSLRRFDLPLSRAESLLEQLDLLHLAQSSPHTLSYGQQHLIALASIACLTPSLMLLDDPLAGLDGKHLGQLWQILNYLREQGGSIVIASHRPLPGLPCSQLWQLQQGQLEIEFAPDEVACVG
ncbi:ABC transporter ATP-binding protein [Shewanella algae]|uniref:ATP-binding cassette domain-containing protein n=1 Tax=Shewanella algae TaxID=38313 RepID=UPI0020352FED|nr:ABC transporter ATP-binding protein [Shewanella algae]MCM2527018.1 ABC transporter ATP-binding protein [Shewanella algae]